MDSFSATETKHSWVRNLPVRNLPAVFHVGTLDPDDKYSQFSYSYEGSGLSVSTFPKEWIRIAQIGGQPVWLLSINRSTRFLDKHALTAEQIALIKSEMQEYFTTW